MWPSCYHIAIHYDAQVQLGRPTALRHDDCVHGAANGKGSKSCVFFVIINFQQILMYNCITM